MNEFNSARYAQIPVNVPLVKFRIDATIFIPLVLAKGMEGQQVQAVLIQVGALRQPVCISCFHNSFEMIIRLYPTESSETCSASSRQSCPNFCSPDSPKKSFAGTQSACFKSDKPSKNDSLL